jgi:hypothetical protein
MTARRLAKLLLLSLLLIATAFAIIPSSQSGQGGFVENNHTPWGTHFESNGHR